MKKKILILQNWFMYLLEVKIKECTSTIKLISENQIFFKNEKEEDAAY